MKHFLNYLLLMLLTLCGGGEAVAQGSQVGTVKYPVVGDRNTESVEIICVECTPTATTLYMGGL